MKRENEPFEHFEGEFSFCLKSEEVQRPWGGNVLLLLLLSLFSSADSV